MSSGAAMSRAVLIVVDMLNRYEHDDAEALVDSVAQTVDAMRALIGRAREHGVPVIWVNDNYEDFAAGREELVSRALDGSHRALVEPVLPPADAPFLTKARHSIFFETQLDYVLRHIGAERVVLIGQVTEQCILYSALDAYVRHYAVAVPRDAVAHIHPELADAALRMMRTNMRAEVMTASALFEDTGAVGVPARAPAGS